MGKYDQVVAWKPMLPEEVRELPKETLQALCSRSAFRCLEAINRISDEELEEFAKKRPKDLAVTAGVLIDKQEVLRKQPDAEDVIRDPDQFNRMLQSITKVLLERGVKIEIPGALKVETQPRAIDVEAVD